MIWVIVINEDSYYDYYDDRNIAIVKALSLAKQGKDVQLYNLPQLVRREGPNMAMRGEQGKVTITFPPDE